MVSTVLLQWQYRDIVHEVAARIRAFRAQEARDTWKMEEFVRESLVEEVEGVGLERLFRIQE